MEKIYSKQKNRKKKNFFPQDFPFNGSLLSLSFPLSHFPRKKKVGDTTREREKVRGGATGFHRR